jgi:hypothetical protein
LPRLPQQTLVKPSIGAHLVNQGFRTNEPDVIYQLFDQEVVAIYLPTGVYHSLNAVAGDIFLALGSTGTTASRVASDLASKYDALPETIHRDVLKFLGQLAQESLIVSVNIPIDPAVDEPSANGHPRIPYVAPSLQTFSDLQQLLLLDPVHDVSPAGWPNLPQEETAVANAEAFRYRIAGPHVIFERFEEEMVALNVSCGAYYTLHGPAEDVFLLLPDNPTLEEIQKALASKYVLDEVVDLDALLRNYLGNLESAGLILLEPLPPAADPSSARTLVLQRPGSGLPFSSSSLQILEVPQAPASPAPVGEGLPAGKRRYRASDLLYAAAGGEMVAVDLDSGQYYRFNEAASDAFALLRGQLNLEELAGTLIQKYEIAERDLIAAAMIFVWHLLRMQLVTAVPAEQERPAPPPALPIPPKRLPFKGFDVTLHQDLMDLMRSMNVPASSSSELPVSRSLQFCDMLHHYFDEAAARLGVTDRFLDVAGAKLQVRCAGNDSEIEAAFAHLIGSSGTSADLTIHVWNCSVPATDYFLTLVLEKLHANWGAVCGSRGEVLDFHSERVPVIYHPGPDILSVVDIGRGQAYFMKRDASPLPYWEIGSPFRYILHAWFSARGLQFVHGGAVGTSQGGVLLVGKGGSGKSTTSMLCVKDGLLYAGDDYCLADPKTGFLFSLYNTGKLKGAEDLERLPEMTGRSRNRDSFEQGGVGKGIFFFSDIWPERLTPGFPLRAILIPRVSGQRDSRLEPCGKGEALLALLPSTVAQLPTANQADCDRLAELAGELPAYVFHLGSDLEQIPALVRRLLD